MAIIRQELNAGHQKLEEKVCLHEIRTHVALELLPALLSKISCSKCGQNLRRNTSTRVSWRKGSPTGDAHPIDGCGIRG